MMDKNWLSALSVDGPTFGCQACQAPNLVVVSATRTKEDAMERRPTDTVQLKLRIREDLRQQLEADASARKISMNAAMTERLEWSFLIDEVGQGRVDIMMLTGIITALTNAIEKNSGKKWYEDNDTFGRIKRMIIQALDQAPEHFRLHGLARLPRTLHQVLMDLAVAGAGSEQRMEGSKQ
jgi:hypothetical protein